MAFTPFYMQTTGNDLNAGSTTADNALVTDTGGTYNQGTGAGGTDQYVASAGTPFSATVVGEYISVYTAGATFATFVGKITAVNAGGASVDVSLTIIYGTRPANASTKTAKTGGAWASLAACASTGVLNTGTVPQSTKINVKAGTYANTTTNRTIGLAGTTLLPLWIDGYKTSPNDLDSVVPTSARVPGTDIPTFTFTTGVLAAAGHQIYSNLSVSSTGNSTTFATTSSDTVDRVQCANTNTGSSARAANVNCAVTASAFTSASAASACVTAGGNADVMDCVISGAAIGLTCSTSLVNVVGCEFIGQSGQCITYSTGGGLVERNTFYGGGASAVDGVKWTGTPSLSLVANNIFDTLTNGINNGSGANTDLIRTRNNDFHSVTNTYVGFADIYNPCDQTDSSSPFVNAGTGNFTLAAGSNARQNGSPGQFETVAVSSYLSIGAYQPTVGGSQAITWRVGP